MFDSSKIQPHIAFTDLREWMAEVDKLGELKTVRGAQRQPPPCVIQHKLRYLVYRNVSAQLILIANCALAEIQYEVEIAGLGAG